jgi:hypothetical protein
MSIRRDELSVVGKTDALVDFSMWNLGDALIPSLTKALNKLASESARFAFSSLIKGTNGCDKPWAYLPVTYSSDDGAGGKPVKDATTIYINFDSAGLDEGPVLKFSFRDLVETTMEDERDPGEWSTRLKNDLLSLVQKIERFEKSKA